MENIVVQKFGGSSVANGDRIRNVARRIIATRAAGNHVVVVLSAQGNTTDHLLEKARELNPQPSKRELDMLLATGEQQSVALMAMAIHSLGYQAVSLNAVQVGIHSTQAHGNGHITHIATNRIIQELNLGNIVLVAGFQGVNQTQDITTLGRGASDTTAVALAAVLNAKVCEIYSDVDGIYTVDPRIVQTAKKLPALGYDAMLELAFAGVQMLHGRAVEMAKKYQVEIIVRSSMQDTEGTWIKEDSQVEQLTVSGIAIDRNVAKITVVGMEDTPGTAFKVFSILAKEQIYVDIISQGISQAPGLCSISFTVSRQDMAAARNVLAANQALIGFQNIETEESLAKISVVGAGMATNSGVAATMFEALFESGVNINMISTSEIKIAVLVDETLVSTAATAIHDKFDGVLGGAE